MKKYDTKPTALERGKMSKLRSRRQPPNQPYLYPWSHNRSAAVDDLLDTLTIELDWPTLTDQMTSEQNRSFLHSIFACAERSVLCSLQLGMAASATGQQKRLYSCH